jgi:NADH dehydrogenase FAD-containing subunit
LFKWSAEIKGDKIVVTANQKELKSKVGRVVTSAKAKANAIKSEETVVIVGGGSGGIHTIESLRMVSLNIQEVTTLTE